MTKEGTELKQSVKAPVKKGAKVANLLYVLGEKEVGRVEILTKESGEKAGFLDYLKESDAKNQGVAKCCTFPYLEPH